MVLAMTTCTDGTASCTDHTTQPRRCDGAWSFSSTNCSSVKSFPRPRSFYPRPIRQLLASFYRMRDKASCGEALACASIAVPVCCRTCAFASLALSAAKSASSILERAAVVYSATFINLRRYIPIYFAAHRTALSPAPVQGCAYVASALVVESFRLYVFYVKPV